GVGLPEHVVTNKALSKNKDTSEEWIRTRTGIEERRFASPGQGSSELGSLAAEAAIADAEVEKDELDGVVFATMTPDYIFPGNGPLLQNRIGLANIPTFDIRQQCSGFLYGLDLADSLLKSGKFRRLLVVGAEVHTPFMPWNHGWDTTIGLDDREPTEDEREFNTRSRDRTVLFGDGAGAMVVESGEESSRGLLLTKLYTDGSLYDALWVRGASFLNRPWITTEQIEDSRIIPDMSGRDVFKQAVTKMPAAVRSVCEEAGVSVEEIDLLLIHQANLRIIEGVAKQLKLPAEKVPHNIERYGNTTAGTLPILFHELKQEGRIREGSLIAFTALGSGLHWGAALYRA
ncbi:MAG: 3-oxoacyl-[acyl-carrier-protein] synthase III C-terminal domain-containing protein, partial [Thermoanaerobaculia bacterium]|nr:3-oxoacyl-[acyl-carrier-protein] synthase III C-terminal domain-containing protein [Thermoanaerobaculia bacterium]